MTRKNDKKNTKADGKVKSPAHSSGARSSGWMIMIFFASGFMFFIGVLVGRNAAPVHFDKERLEQQLAHLQRSVLDKSSDVTAAIEKKLQKNPGFDFYDKLKGKPDFKGGHIQTPVKKPRYQKPGPMALAMARKAAIDAGASAEPGTRPESGLKTREAEKTAGMALRVAEAKIAVRRSEPVEQEPVKPKPLETKKAAVKVEEPAQRKTPSVGGRKYAIQVASLKDTRSAESIRNKFRSKGYPAYIQEAIVQGRGQWFRVRIGPYSDKSQAASDLSRLQQAGVDAILFLSDTGAKNNAGDKNENNKG